MQHRAPVVLEGRRVFARQVFADLRCPARHAPIDAHDLAGARFVPVPETPRELGPDGFVVRRDDDQRLVRRSEQAILGPERKRQSNRRDERQHNEQISQHS